MANDMMTDPPVADRGAMQAHLAADDRPLPVNDPFAPRDEQEIDEDQLPLRELLSQWHYMPGTSWINLVRRHPAKFRGYSTGGWLEEIHEPFDEQFVQQRWGGGIYVAEVFQLDEAGNKTRCVKRRVFSVSGDPSSWKGPDGSPAPIPQNQQQGNPGLNQLNNQLGNNASWIQQQAVPSVRDQLAARKQELDMMGMMREITQQSANAQSQAIRESANSTAELLKMQLASQARELEELKKSSKENAREAARPAELSIETIRQQMENQRASFERTMTEMRQSHETYIREQGKAHEKQLDALTQQHRDQLMQARAQAESDKNSLQAIYTGQLQTAQREIDRAERNMGQSGDAVKAMMSAQYEARLAAAISETTRLREITDREIARLNEEIRNARAELIAERTAGKKSATEGLSETMKLMQSVSGMAESMGYSKENGLAGSDDPIAKYAALAPIVGTALQPILSRVDGVLAARAQNKAQAQQSQMQYANPYAIAGAPTMMAPLGAPTMGMPLLPPQQQQQYQQMQQQPMMMPMTPDQQAQQQMVMQSPQQMQQMQMQQMPQGQMQPQQTQAAPQVTQPAGDQYEFGPPADLEAFTQTGIGYLCERLDNDEPAADVAAELVKSLGAEAIALLKTVPTSTVLDELFKGAVDTSLVSPRGKMWVNDVFKRMVA